MKIKFICEKCEKEIEVQKDIYKKTYEDEKLCLSCRQSKFIGDDLVKMDVAIEIMADMMGKRSTQKINEKNKDIINKINQELVLLKLERDEMYKGNELIIEKILTIYAKEIRDYYK